MYGFLAMYARVDKWSREMSAMVLFDNGYGDSLLDDILVGKCLR